MKLYFDKEINYAEIFFRSTPNYGVELNSEVIQFRDEQTEEVVGYGFYEAEQSVLKSEYLSFEQKEDFKKLMKGRIWV